ncbi:MAG: ribosome silencing factor [Phycisphaerales bacterium]|nr:ribosome silencing factor [Phycisphaerales bacterium]
MTTMTGRDELTSRDPSFNNHPAFAGVRAADPVVTRVFAIDAARLLADDKCEDVVLLDVQGLSQICDYIVVATGTSDRQMRGSADDVKKLAETTDNGVFRHSVDERTTWYVLDCVHVVVHIFEPNARAHYDLELLWGDAPRVEWQRPGEKNRDLAGLHGG